MNDETIAQDFKAVQEQLEALNKLLEKLKNDKSASGRALQKHLKAAASRHIRDEDHLRTVQDQLQTANDRLQKRVDDYGKLSTAHNELKKHAKDMKESYIELAEPLIEDSLLHYIANSFAPANVALNTAYPMSETGNRARYRHFPTAEQLDSLCARRMLSAALTAALKRRVQSGTYNAAYRNNYAHPSPLVKSRSSSPSHSIFQELCVHLDEYNCLKEPSNVPHHDFTDAFLNFVNTPKGKAAAAIAASRERLNGELIEFKPFSP